MIGIEDFQIIKLDDNMPADKHNRFFNFCTCSIIPRLLASALLIVAGNQQAMAEEGMASDALVHKAGLTVDWFTQSGIGARGEIVDWDLNINENNSTTYYVVEAGNIREVISERSLNAFGKPFGKDGAIEHIEIRKEVLTAELANSGATDVEISVDQYTLPQSTIYLITSEGLASAIDADSGTTLWTTQLGNAEAPSVGIGANDQYVAGAVGSSIYLMDPANGKVLWSRGCKTAISGPPAVTEEFVYVPLLDGRVEGMPIADQGRGSFAFVARGAGLSRPMITETTVSWSTRKGDLNVAARYGKRNRSIAYRLKTDDAIVDSPAYQDGKIFVGSLDGYVYALDENQGSILWELSIAEEISQSPVPVGDNVYVISDEGSLFGIDIASGDFKWRAPLANIGTYLGASQEKLYLTDRFGSLLVVNAESGAVLSRVDAGNIQYVLPNYQTDRIYIASNSGMVQCLHEVASKRPYFHNGEFNAAAQPAEVGAEEEAPEMTDEENPFATTGEPAAEAAPLVPGSKEDPFATAGEEPVAGDAGETEMVEDEESDPFAVEEDAETGEDDAETEDEEAENMDEESDPFAVDDGSAEPAAEDSSGDDDSDSTEDDPFNK